MPELTPGHFSVPPSGCLPSGSSPAGRGDTDPLTVERHDVIGLGSTPKETKRVRSKLLAQLHERRNPRTKAAVNQLMDRYPRVVDVEPAMRR